MTAPYNLVDAFLQVPPLSSKPLDRKIDPNIAKWFKPGDQVKHRFTIDDLVRDMDAAEVEQGVMTAGVMRLAPSPYTVGQNIADETYEKICTGSPQCCSSIRPLPRLLWAGSDRHDAGRAMAGAGGEGIWFSFGLDYAVAGGSAAKSCLLLSDLCQMR